MNNKLFNRNFTLVVLGQIVSVLGSAILRFALDLYILDITGRADIFAVVVAISAIPGIICTPIGGAIADRLKKRNLMISFDLANGLVVLTLVLLMSAGSANVIAIAAIITMLTLISAMYQPTVQSSVPVIVDEANLAGANGIVSAIGALSGMAGPVIGGILYSQWGINPLLTISCAAFFISAVMLMFVVIPFAQRERTNGIIPTILSDVKDGFTYVVKENPIIIRLVALAAMLNAFLIPLFVIGVPYILRIVMKSSDMQYGIGLGIIQFSMIVGAITVGVTTKRWSIRTFHRPLMVCALLLLPIAAALTPAILAMGYWPSFILFLVFTMGIMFLSTTISIFFITDVQKRTHVLMLGKAMAFIMAAAQCAAPVGQLIYGGLFQAFSSTVFIPVLFSFIAVVSIAALAKAALREKAPARIKPLVGSGFHPRPSQPPPESSLL